MYLQVSTRALRRGLMVLALALPALAFGQAPITLHGAVQFNDDHAFNKSLLKFEELVKKYYGKPVNFVLHRNSELGLEKDYFAYMNQGISVDYAIVSPAHMSTFAKAAPLLDMPFLFRDLAHWNKVLDSDAFQPIVDEVNKKADVLIIGYAGGGTRNIFSKYPVRNMAELNGLTMRVMGAPIQTKIFESVTAKPSVIAYNEIYNAIQSGVIQGAENEAAGIEQMKFYEVAPSLSLTQHAITVRPIAFSGKTLKKLPPDLQAAVVKAGKEAGKFGRDLESGEDAGKIAALEKAGRLKTYPFTERPKLLQLAEPVKQAYAKEVDAVAILNRVDAIK
ncbi:TRAP transporter substrate-binding protein [Variovorax robiniae]|uniref:TRAP transporter substrate-binding protein n=1 Tax=Variovorax robiniae TaxID=1836199 RepID=A0ABU8X860_9BURK